MRASLFVVGLLSYIAFQAPAAQDDSTKDAGRDKEKQLTLPNEGFPSLVLAKAGQNGTAIAVSFGAQPVTYTVNVPIQNAWEDADGTVRTKTVMRKETRTRHMGSARQQRQTYTVMIPVRQTVKGEDGEEKVVTKLVPEQRTRMVTVRSGGRPKLIKLSECVFRSLDGKPIDSAEAARRLKKSSPVVLADKSVDLHPFHRAALNPNLMLLSLPAKVFQMPRPKPVVDE